MILNQTRRMAYITPAETGIMGTVIPAATTFNGLSVDTSNYSAMLVGVYFPGNTAGLFNVFGALDWPQNGVWGNPINIGGGAVGAAGPAPELQFFGFPYFAWNLRISIENLDLVNPYTLSAFILGATYHANI